MFGAVHDGRNGCRRKALMRSGMDFAAGWAKMEEKRRDLA